MSSFTRIRKVGFDTETTGPDPDEARIVTAALVVRGGGKPDQVFTWLINPGIPIPPETTAIHGIDDAKAQAEGQDPKTALDDLAAKLASALVFGMPVVAFNLAYDWTVLDRDLCRHGLLSMAVRLGDNLAPALIDPHVIDKQMDRYRRGTGMRKLKPTCDVYGIELTDWHSADADALAALLIAEAQFERYPQMSRFAPAELFAEQQRWRAEQQAGLQAYFRRQPGKAGEVVDPSWPLRPAAVEAVSS